MSSYAALPPSYPISLKNKNSDTFNAEILKHYHPPITTVIFTVIFCRSPERRMAILCILRSTAQKNYAFQLILRNVWCNLCNLLCNFMYFLSLSNQIANLKSYAVNYAVTAIKNYAFQMFLGNPAYCCMVLLRITILPHQPNKDFQGTLFQVFPEIHYFQLLSLALKFMVDGQDCAAKCMKEGDNATEFDAVFRSH